MAVWPQSGGLSAAGTAGRAAAGFIADHPEPLGHDQRSVVDHGGEAKVRGHLGAGEQFLVRGAPGGGVRVPAAFRVREAIADLVTGTTATSVSSMTSAGFPAESISRNCCPGTGTGSPSCSRISSSPVSAVLVPERIAAMR